MLNVFDGWLLTLGSHVYKGTNNIAIPVKGRWSRGWLFHWTLIVIIIIYVLFILCYCHFGVKRFPIVRCRFFLNRSRSSIRNDNKPLCTYSFIIIIIWIWNHLDSGEMRLLHRSKNWIIITTICMCYAPWYTPTMTIL